MLSDRIITASRFSNRPLYLQLRDALAERITSGEWKPTAAIPNESDLAREFGVSAGTMRKALDLMEAERLLTRRQGRGTFVNDQSSDELAARFSNIRGPDGQRMCGQVKSAEITEGPANPTECARLRLRTGDRVYRIHRVRHHKGQIFLVEEVSLPAALFPDLESKKASVTDRVIVLAQEYGILLGKAEERVSLSLPSAAVAQKLGVTSDSPVMVLDRVVLTLDNQPVEWRMAWCELADRYYMAEMI
jgi:GntR family transcriptional regulator